MSAGTTSGHVANLSRADWQERLEFVVETMRELSRQTDPQAMVQFYAQRVRRFTPSDGNISLSRRDLVHPQYRITRYHGWGPDHNPWKSKERLPIYRGGLLGELIYGEQPRVIDRLEISANDPAAEFLRGYGTLVAIPLFENGIAMNMVIVMRREMGGYADHKLTIPEQVWMSNLFGRMTHSLLLGQQVKQAYDSIDRELKVVADIQRSLLPKKLPTIPTLELAVDYRTSRRAGGDYYDFFELPEGKWGFLIADVAGHGTPAAVVMAITHSIAHTLHEPPDPPSKLLNFVNRHLTARYTTETGSFVTAFYGIYDPRNRTITYANAGHDPPRHKHAQSIVLGSLEGGVNLPLGIEPNESYIDAAQKFWPGDALIFYTDGITEARSPGGEMFGSHRLDEILLAGSNDPHEILQRTNDAVAAFTDGLPASDDRTVLVAAVK